MRIALHYEKHLSRNTLAYPLLATGDESGSVYLMLGPRNGLVLQAKGGMILGDFATSGGFTPLPKGAVLILEQQ